MYPSMSEAGLLNEPDQRGGCPCWRLVAGSLLISTSDSTG